VLLAWLLGSWQLAGQSMWVDEWFTNYNVGQTWTDFLPSIIATERRPPLHFALLKLWGSLAGQEEFALRLYSVGMVALAVALLFALGRRLFGVKTAALAALLLAASPFWLLYGRMIRAYSQTVVLALAATLLLVVAVDGRRLWWAAYALAAAALIYTDYSGLPILAAHGIFVVAGWATTSPRRWQPVRAWAAAMVVTALLYLPWLPSIFAATARGVRITDLAGGPLGFAVKLGVPLYVWAVGETIYPWQPPGAVAAVVIGVLALWGLWRAARLRAAAGWLLLAWLGLPLLFTATLLSLVATDITFLNAASRTPGAAPAYLLAAAVGFMALRRRWLKAVALVCIAVGITAAILNYFAGVQYLNPIYALPAREVAAELAAAAQPGDLILAERDTLLGHYYQLRPGAAAYQDVEPAANLAWIAQHHPDTIWLITFGRDSTEGAFGTPELLTGLQTAYTRGAARAYGPVDPSYQALKQRLTGRPAYADKLTVQPFTRR
jgi:uncharacterized membrane protein